MDEESTNELVPELTNQPDVSPVVEIDSEAAEVSTVTGDQEDNDKTENRDLSFDELPLPDQDDDAIEEEKIKKPKSKEERLLFKKERELERERQNRRQLEQRLAAEESVKHQQTYRPDYSDVSRENFATEEEWIAAVTDKRIHQRQEEMKVQHARESQQKQREEFVGKITEIKDKGALKYSDFDDLVEPIFGEGFPTNEPLAAAIADSDFGDDILYFMGKYPEKARELALLPPVKAIKAIANLELRFKEKKKSTAVKAAPKLIEPLKSGKPQSSGTLSSMTPEQIERMDMKEFSERYKKEYTGSKRHF